MLPSLRVPDLVRRFGDARGFLIEACCHRTEFRAPSFPSLPFFPSFPLFPSFSSFPSLSVFLSPVLLSPVLLSFFPSSFSLLLFFSFLFVFCWGGRVCVMVASHRRLMDFGAVASGLEVLLHGVNLDRLVYEISRSPRLSYLGSSWLCIRAGGFGTGFEARSPGLLALDCSWLEHRRIPAFYIH